MTVVVPLLVCAPLNLASLLNLVLVDSHMTCLSPVLHLFVE